MISKYILTITYCDINKKRIDKCICDCITNDVQQSIKDVTKYYTDLYDWVIVDCDAEIQIWQSIKYTILEFIFSSDWIRNKFANIEKD